MDEILIKAGGFLFMIALGFVLKRIGLFSLDDSGFLSKLVLKVTLPMAIIKNFQGLELNRSYLMAIGIGFAVNFIAIAVVLLLTRKKSPAHRAGDFSRVERLRHVSQKCRHFFEGMQAAARTRFRSHTCGLGSVFSDVHAAGKHDLTLFRRLRTAELCEALAA